MCEEIPRLRVADLARLAQQRRENLLQEGRQLHPVQGSSRNLASHFWGRAWMKHLALCEAGGLCLAPGRTLLRHGCVLDLQLAPGRVEALVSAQELVEVQIDIAPLEDERLEALKEACSGRIDSLVSLLEGCTDEAVLQRLCDPETGLLPEPHDWHMNCTCPDWAEPCPHAAAALYATGTLIDVEPTLLFQLRQVEASSLIEAPKVEAEVFDTSALGSMFGIDLDVE